MASQSNCSYAVVEFKSGTKLKSAAVVPLHWIDENSMCQWPAKKLTSQQLKKMIKNKTEPRPTWDLYKIDILTEEDSYEDANQKLEIALNRTDCNESSDTSLTTPKRRIQRPNRFVESETDSDDSDAPTSCPLPPSRVDLEHHKHAPLRSKNNEASTPTSEQGMHSSQPWLKSISLDRGGRTNLFPAVSNSPLYKLDESKEADQSFDPEQSVSAKILIRGVSKLKSQNKEIIQTLSEIVKMMKMMKNNQSEEQLFWDLPDGLPIRTKEQFLRFEAEVASTAELFDQMVKALKIVGGEDLTVLAKRVLPRLLQNPFAEECNLSGQRGKTALNGSAIHKAFLVVAQQNVRTRGEDPKKAEDAMRSWLGGARDREGGSRFSKKIFK